MLYDLKKVKGLGDKTIVKLKENNIFNTYDLILNFPKRYINLETNHYNELKHNEVVTILGEIKGEATYSKKRVPLVTANISLDNNLIKLVIFNRPYLKDTLTNGKSVLVKGKYNFFKEEILVNYITTQIKPPKISSVYDIPDITDYTLSNAIKYIIDNELVDIYETIPYEIINKYRLLSRKEAIFNRHIPKDNYTLNKAFNRFKVEEAFFHLLSYLSKLNPRNKRESIKYDLKLVKEHIDMIPYELTNDQKNVINEIYKDFKKEESLYRLIQGDVGSGKTVVAFLAAIGMISDNYQVALMAPTEILARQHYENFKKLFPNIKSLFLTSSLKDKNKIIEDINNIETKIIFGTHILASDNVVFNNLGLIIIDEQHKFGVEIRNKLIQKSLTKDVLYLTATPIPRSLSLTFLGDLDVSEIKEKPIKKENVKTILMDDDLESIINLIKETSNKNEQSFIVAPAILENENKYSIESLTDILKPHFLNNLYVIHGNLKQEEIDTIMNDYIHNKKGILLSTTIIEVGIDVKNATTIFIFDANQFGLFQLHQLRGRVGRGEISGVCYLISSDLDHERLNLLKDINDGFLLARYDLKLRGPGVFSGIIQTGKLQFQYLDFSEDLYILQKLNNDIKHFLKNIDDYPYLKKIIDNKVI